MAARWSTCSSCPGCGVNPSTLIPPQPTDDVNGSADTAPRTFTPGTAAMRSPTSAGRTRPPPRGSGTGGRSRRAASRSRCSGSKPGDTLCSRTKLRTSSPAPISSISENATSDTTSRLRSRRRDVPKPPSPCVFRPPALSAGVEIEARRAQRRREAEHDPGQDRDDEGEGQHGAVDARSRRAAGCCRD